MGRWDSSFVSSARGAAVEVTIGDACNEHMGELLLVRGDGVILLTSGRAGLVTWEAMRELSFDNVPVDDLEDGRRPSAEHHDRMRMVSRYPFGLTDEQMDRLLSGLGQSEPEVLR